MLDKKRERLESLYQDYLDLTRIGKTSEQALIEFDYLHPVTFARLKKFVSEKDFIETTNELMDEALDNMKKGLVS